VSYPLVLSLFATMTHCYQQCGFVIPYLGIRANTESAGKTRLMQLVGSLCERPSPLLTNPSGASLLRRLDRDHPTLLVDESEELQKSGTDTREIFDSGYKPGAIVSRALGAGEITYAIYGPKIYGMIGDPDRTIRSRSIMVLMEKGDIAIDDKEQVFTPLGNAIGLRLAALVNQHPKNTGTEPRRCTGMMCSIESTYLGFANELQKILPVQRDREIWECLFAICTHIAPGRLTELTWAAQAISTLKTRPARRYADLAGASADADTYQYAQQLARDSYEIARAAGGTNIHTHTLIAELIKSPMWKYFTNPKGVRIGDSDGHYVLATMLQRALGNHTCPKPVKVQGLLLRGYTLAWLQGLPDPDGNGVTELPTPAPLVDRTPEPDAVAPVTTPDNSVTPLPVTRGYGVTASPTPVTPDVVFSPGFLTPAEADALFAAILANRDDLKQNHIQLYGRRALPRLEAWYGSWDYNYSKGIILKAAPIPTYLQIVFRQLEAAGYGEYNAVLINYYRDGRDHISPHSDADYGDDEPTIPSLTLGAARPFRLAKIVGKNKLDKTTTVEYLPGHGDLLVMHGRTNLEWQHWVPKTTQPVGERINLTFRRNFAVEPSTKPLGGPFEILQPKPEPEPEVDSKSKVAISGCCIYAPAGQAGEYAPLAANSYVGCGMCCAYCYVARMRFLWPGLTLVEARKKFNAGAVPKVGWLERLRRDATKYQAAGIHEQVMLSFTSDMYNPYDISLTRPTIETLIEFGLGFCILTKGGTYSLMDLDLYRPERDAYACTLTCLDDSFSKKWERLAALPADRIKALRTMHDAGVYTWVSLEPVVDTEASLALVKATHKFVDLYKIGRANYLPSTHTTDWETYTHRMLDALSHYGAAHYIKRDLQKYLPSGYHNPMRVPQHH
jgi:alkylated DNA repair dioxygenase AlkB